MFISVVCTVITLIISPKKNECSEALDEINQSLINEIKKIITEDKN